MTIDLWVKICAKINSSTQPSLNKLPKIQCELRAKVKNCRNQHPVHIDHHLTINQRLRKNESIGSEYAQSTYKHSPNGTNPGYAHQKQIMKFISISLASKPATRPLVSKLYVLTIKYFITHLWPLIKSQKLELEPIRP